MSKIKADRKSVQKLKIQNKQRIDQEVLDMSDIDVSSDNDSDNSANHNDLREDNSKKSPKKQNDLHEVLQKANSSEETENKKFCENCTKCVCREWSDLGNECDI